MMKRYLSAPLTSVASERLFSSSSCVFTDRHTGWLRKKADMLLFIKHNLPLISFKYWVLSTWNRSLACGYFLCSFTTIYKWLSYLLIDLVYARCKLHHCHFLLSTYGLELFVCLIFCTVSIEGFDLISTLRSFHTSGCFIICVFDCWFTEVFTSVDCTILESGSYWP